MQGTKDYELDELELYSTAAQVYGAINADLKRKGTPIEPLETLIAAHAKSLELTLVTNNTGKFAWVDGLELEDWVG